jgi:hypothetical protein
MYKINARIIPIKNIIIIWFSFIWLSKSIMDVPKRANERRNTLGKKGNVIISAKGMWIL